MHGAGETRENELERDANTLRDVSMQLGFHRNSEGSVLYQAGRTVVLVTASVEETVPDFMRGRGVGWATAEYQMHPRANPSHREKRDGRGKPLSGRSQEIQRLIGRSIRCALDMSQIGERTIALDCDVLEADGGTRTASITAAWVALAMALSKLRDRGVLIKPALRDQVAAISVGHVDGQLVLDLCYAQDSKARMDANLVATAKGAIVEIQATAEGEAVARDQVDAMIDLGMQGINTLIGLQKKALEQASIDLQPLMIA